MENGNIIRTGRCKTENHATYTARKWIMKAMTEYFDKKNAAAAAAKK